MMDDVREQLKELKVEDFIWIIFIFVSIMAIVSDKYEKDWVVSKKTSSYKTYKGINIFLLGISFLVYLYFVLLSYKKYKSSLKNKKVSELFFSKINLFAASLFLIGGLLNIFIEVNSNDFDGNLFL